MLIIKKEQKNIVRIFYEAFYMNYIEDYAEFISLYEYSVLKLSTQRLDIIKNSIVIYENYVHEFNTQLDYFNANLDKLNDLERDYIPIITKEFKLHCDMIDLQLSYFKENNFKLLND